MMRPRTGEFAALTHPATPFIGVQVGVQRILLLYGGHCANRMLRALGRHYERRDEHSHLSAQYTYTILTAAAHHLCYGSYLEWL
jgi:hypothetical protein